MRRLLAAEYEIPQNRTIVEWRATADEDGHYCVAVAL
jgi:hypothetical protein